MIDDAKLDELAALADGTREPESGMWFYEHELKKLHNACDPETIRALVGEVRESRKMLEICRDNPREEDAERIAHLEEFVAAMRYQAASSPAESSQDYRDGYEAQGNWIAHHLRVLDQSA